VTVSDGGRHSSIIRDEMKLSYTPASNHIDLRMRRQPDHITSGPTQDTVTDW